MIRTIWVHSGQFGCLTKLGGKRTELVQKFVPRSRVRIFRSERTRSTLFDPKLMFWCISYHLGAFGTIWLPYETRCKTGRTSKSSCHQVAPEFFATNAPDPRHWTRTQDCFLPYETRCKTGRTSAKVRGTKSRQNFSQRTHLIHPIGP